MGKEYGAIPTELQTSDRDSPTFTDYSVTFVTAPPLTVGQKVNRCIRATLPIVVAVLLLVGSGIFFGRAVRNEYARNGATDTIRSNHHQTSAQASNDVSSSTELPDQTSCLQNLGCRYLGLTGACCPTDAGLYLGCCPKVKTRDTFPLSTNSNVSNTSQIAAGEQTLKSTNSSSYDVDDSQASSDTKLCSMNPLCHKSGLIGTCCPTDKGFNLGCCTDTSFIGTNDTAAYEKSASIEQERNDTGSTSTSASKSSSCSANPACGNLGLIGDCCPTRKGVRLGCCSA